MLLFAPTSSLATALVFFLFLLLQDSSSFQVEFLHQKSTLFTRKTTRFAIQQQQDGPSVTASSTTQAEHLEARHVTLSKPMGLILEEVEGDDEDQNNENNNGVVIAGMTGTAALASQKGIVDICVGDYILAINDDTSCQCWSLEQVMDHIINNCNDHEISLTLGRSKEVVAVCFAYNGVAIAAKPGTHICNLAFDAGAPINYNCRSGSCGTCEQVVILEHNNKNGKPKEQEQRLVRPCVARVGKKLDRITVLGSSSSNIRHNKAAP